MQKVLLIKAKTIAECDIIKTAFPSSDEKAGAELVGWPGSTRPEDWKWVYKVVVDETHLLANRGLVLVHELDG